MLERLTAILSDFFEVGGDCYHYILERVKHAELTPDDFREYDDDDVAEIAEYLIDNGVTVQRWIPVTERLPDESGNYLTYDEYAYGYVEVLHYSARHEAFNAHDDTSNDHEMRCTHWMPLPEPPKEVAE